MGQRIPHGDDACTFEARDLAVGFTFKVYFKLWRADSDLPIDSGEFELTIRKDGTWEFEAKPDCEYDFGASVASEPSVRLEAGQSKFVVVFNVLTC